MKKRCTKCKEEKSFDEFYTDKRGKYGLFGKCKKCFNQYQQIAFRDSDWILKQRERARKKNNGKPSDYPRRRESILESVRKWTAKNPEKKKAQQRANNAVRDGKITRKLVCERCKLFGNRMEKHHEDYSKPLEVTWLCSKCHGITKRKPLP